LAAANPPLRLRRRRYPCAFYVSLNFAVIIGTQHYKSDFKGEEPLAFRQRRGIRNTTNVGATQIRRNTWLALNGNCNRYRWEVNVRTIKGQVEDAIAMLRPASFLNVRVREEQRIQLQ
jgi:hypothetical protein